MTLLNLSNPPAAAESTAFLPASPLQADVITRALRDDDQVTALRHILEQLNTELNERFLSGEPTPNLVYGRALAMDQLLAAIWQSFDWQEIQGFALIAVGGYGRGELLPSSDIDLLILFADEHNFAANQERVEAFVALLWDLKLEVGHSARTIATCAEKAAAEVTVMTNLLEARVISGNPALLDELHRAVSPQRMWPSAAFYRAKHAEQTERYQKFNHTEYNLEPNVKNGPGTLRDLQTIGWIAKRHFGKANLVDLIHQDFLSETEYQTITDIQAFLWRTRYALHMITGREEDRLLFELQEQVAELFGYRDANGQSAVEHLMQDYFRAVFNARAHNLVLLQLLDEIIHCESAETEITAINSRFQIRKGYIETTNAQVFQRTPSALLEIFVLCAQYPEIEDISANTMRLMLAARNLIDGAFRQDLRNITFFMELMRSPQGVYHGLLRMNQYGILGLYLPEFGKIVGHMQFDLFHVYTVDAHILLTIRSLRSFRHRENTQRFPIATEIVHTLPKVELVYIAALYHDIGKGRQADHCIEGASEVERFASRHRLSEQESELVVWLVRHHLLLSSTAQRLDISDPLVINSFAEQVATLERLNYLYVLTVADIYATNPELWNSWRAALMQRLYHEARQALERGLDQPLTRAERIQETKDAALALLQNQGLERQAVLGLWDNPGDDYFLRETAANIAWHTRAIADSGPKTPLVLMKETGQLEVVGGTQIFIYAPNRVNLFADIAATLDGLNLDIQEARVMTASNSEFSLDTFVVLEQSGNSIGNEPGRLLEVKQRLLQEIENLATSPAPRRRVTRHLKHFQMPAEIIISNDKNNLHTIVEVTASDRPGLLADIGRCLRTLGYVVQSARISTLGEHVEDIFFLVNQRGLPLTSSAAVTELQQTLQATIAETMQR